MISFFHRQVTSLPLAEVWDDRGVVAARRLRWLTSEDIRVLLRAGPLRFVVADVGRGLRWVAEAERFASWKGEIQPHLADPDGAIDLDRFPNGLAYVASEWESIGGAPIVLLEAHH